LPHAPRHRVTSTRRPRILNLPCSFFASTRCQRPAGRSDCGIEPQHRPSNPHSRLAETEQARRAPRFPPLWLVRRLPARRSCVLACPRVRAGITQPLTESVARHSRGTRPLIAPCHKAPRHLHRVICARWVASAIGMPTRKTAANLTGNRSMGTPALGGSQPDPLSGIQRWPRIVATEMAAARPCR